MKPAEETNFIVTTTINEFSMTDVIPMAIAFSYPLLTIATSSVHLVVFNFETKETIHLERSITTDSAVLCVDVNPELTHVVTGHSDGEVCLWSLQTRTALISQYTQDLVSYICFGSGLYIYHVDPNGILCRTIVTQSIFKRSVSTEVIHNFKEPLTALRIHENILYASTCAATSAFVTQPEFKVLWEDNSPTSCFAFFNSQQTKLVARGVGHYVFLSGQDGITDRVFEFSETPKVISLLDENSALVLFNGACEMAVGERRFRKQVPKGMALAHKDKIYIAGTDQLMQLSIASVSQRVDSYIEEGNWETAFAQIESPDDVDNLTGILFRYIATDKFNPQVLFKLVEKLRMTDFIVQMMFTEKKQQILEAFLNSEITNWFLTLDFVLAIADSTKDDKKLIKFLSSIELNLEWLPKILDLCFKRGYNNLMVQLALDYSGDIYLALLILEYTKNYEREHTLLNTSLMDKTDKKAISDAINFILKIDLKNLIEYDEASAMNIFAAALNAAPEVKEPKGRIINKIIPVIKYTSNFWEFISNIIVDERIIIEKNAMNSVKRYIFIGNSPDVGLRKQVLATLLETNQLDDNLRSYLSLIRAAGFIEVEGRLITKLGDVDEFLSYIISSGAREFKDKLLEITTDYQVISRFLQKYPRSLIPINADEFVDLVWKYCNTEVMQQIARSILDSEPLSWHYLSRLFKHKEFSEVADESLCGQYTIFLAKYKPAELLPVLKQLKNVPIEKILDACFESNNLECVLYLCLMTQEIEKGVTFSSEILYSSLIEGGDSNIVNDIIKFLIENNGHPDHEEFWVRVLSVFQLALYAITDEPRKSNITSLLCDFLQRMILYANPVLVTKKFSTLFSFLTFKDTRPIIARMLKTIREKNEFTKTFSCIVKEEAIKAQVSREKEKRRGFVYDSEKCAACGLKLSACNAYASSCGHVFHAECAKAAWCPICNKNIVIEERRSTEGVQMTSLLSLFEEKLDHSIKEENDKQQQNQKFASTIPLEIPTIGDVIQPKPQVPEEIPKA